MFAKRFHHKSLLNTIESDASLTAAKTFQGRFHLVHTCHIGLRIILPVMNAVMISIPLDRLISSCKEKLLNQNYSPENVPSNLPAELPHLRPLGHWEM